MKEIKFIHCADIHLDAPFTGLGAEGGKSSARRQDLKLTFQKIINTARTENADILLISGDLFEHGYVKKPTINFINDCFNTIPDVEIFIIPGNHDPFVPDSFYRNFKWGSNVHILGEDTPCVNLPHLDTSVHGLGFSSFYEENSILDRLEFKKSQTFNFLLLHGTLDMSIGPNLYNPLESSRLDALDMDYIALGHFHTRLLGTGSKQNIYNPGSPEPLGFDEPGEHGVLLGTIRSVDGMIKYLNVQFLKLNDKYYEALEVNVDGCCSSEQVLARIIGRAEQKNASSRLLKITLKGYIDTGFKIDCAELKSYLENIFFFVRLEDATSFDYDLEKLSVEPGLKGLFVRRLLDGLNRTGDLSERDRIMKALYYGLEAMEEGNVNV